MGSVEWGARARGIPVLGTAQDDLLTFAAGIQSWTYSSPNSHASSDLDLNFNHQQEKR